MPTELLQKRHEIEIIHSIDKNLLNTYYVHRMIRKFMGNPKSIPGVICDFEIEDAGWHSWEGKDTGVKQI